ncbi:MerR family transcriptional regulator [Devosia sp. RR2S18]|uniref:MerR family transcriptional regulator n=1 Tax=Devosia rhizosphaerae TaxID=3049774 RepID=UPI00253FAD68|nr:MerR family transcriptional regulator [Devosia sp. RR2S18]WIJ25666.1 MerR family transcriptional regulator [Devosia sp. RR2S18]
MHASAQFLSPADVAARFGVSTKALRLYEQRGLLSPVRTASGWRTYGPDEVARIAEIKTLRSLGLSLAAIERLLAGDGSDLAQALALHQERLEEEVRRTTGAIAAVRHIRAELAQGRTARVGELLHAVAPSPPASLAIELPWPWGGERFELREIRAVNYIIGPLGSGKTRLAIKLAEAMPGAQFLALDRLEIAPGLVQARLESDPSLQLRVNAAQTWLIDEGAAPSPALTALLLELEAASSAPLVIDMVEQDLGRETQSALAAYLRRRPTTARPLFVMTRSSLILDLEEVGPNETIILCPPNHSPPTIVLPCSGAPGYETVASCLATPEVRLRTAGVRVVGPAPH